VSAVEITISGVLYDKLNRTMQQVVLIGEASLTGLGVGGGPIIPPPTDPNAPRPSHPIALPGDPWWGGDLRPTNPIAKPGDPWWGGDLKPTHPIVLPPDCPPGMKPPEPPNPGSEPISFHRRNPSIGKPRPIEARMNLTARRRSPAMVAQDLGGRRTAKLCASVARIASRRCRRATGGARHTSGVEVQAKSTACAELE
jgi:hypothetical protein